MVIASEQAAKSCPTADRRRIRRGRASSRRRPGWQHDPIANSLMRPLGVVMLDVLVDQMIEMTLAEDHEVVEALLFDRLDPPLGIGVEHWRPWLEFEHADVATRLGRRQRVGRTCRRDRAVEWLATGATNRDAPVRRTEPPVWPPTGDRDAQPHL